MNNKTRKWLRAGIETLIHGGTSAMISSITASLVDHDHFALFSKPFFQMFGAGFVGNGGLRFLQWWNNNPLPESETTAPVLGAPETPMISLKPFSPVVPLTTQPQVEPPKV
jgi:hypothetical protein